MAHHHHNVNGKNLFITIILNLIITLAQIIGGIVSNSLALLSDAMHNFSDVLSLIIAYVANKLANKPNEEDKTFGYKRAEILAAFINASLLVGIGIFLIIESIHKLKHPQHINSIWVIGLGALSVILNSLSVFLIKDDAHENMNVKAAYLHLLTDVMTSLGVLIGGILIYFYKIYWVDSVISILIAIYLIYASVDIIKESIEIFMQFSPKEIDIKEVADFIKKEEPLIENVHHIHIWRLNEHQINFEAHLDCKKNIDLKTATEIINRLEKKLHDKFNIEHTTFQCEYKRSDNKDLIVN